MLGKLKGWVRLVENILWKEIRSVCQGWVEPGGARRLLISSLVLRAADLGEPSASIACLSIVS